MPDHLTCRLFYGPKAETGENRLPTLEEQLAAVQTAIADIEANGQDVTVDGRRYTKADLQTLYARESFLQARINQSGQSIFDRAMVARPYRG